MCVCVYIYINKYCVILKKNLINAYQQSRLFQAKVIEDQLLWFYLTQFYEGLRGFLFLKVNVIPRLEFELAY